MEIPQMTGGEIRRQQTEPESQPLLGIHPTKAVEKSDSHVDFSYTTSYGATVALILGDEAGRDDDIERGITNGFQTHYHSDVPIEETKEGEPLPGNVFPAQVGIVFNPSKVQSDSIDFIEDGLHLEGEIQLSKNTESGEPQIVQETDVSIQTVVLESFAEELQDEKRFFLDMALTRNLSLLPREIQEAGEKVGLLVESNTGCGVEEGIAEDAMQDELSPPTKVPLTAYLLLATAVVSLSAIGPLIQFQEGTTTSMKILWRQIATGLVLAPIATRSVIHTGLPCLSRQQLLLFMCMIFCYTVSVLGFALSLEYTSVGNAVILANSQSVLLLAGKLLVGEPINPLEGLGALVASYGALLCSKDSQDSVTSGNSALFGDGLALLSGLCGVGYLVTAKPLRSEMNVSLFMTLNMFLGSVLIVAVMVGVLNEKLTLDADAATGILGFLQPAFDRFPLEIMIVFVCNIGGTLGYVQAMQWFDNIVLSVATLLEPAVAELLGCLMGVSALPGWKGWTGNALVCVGTATVVLPSNNKNNKKKHHKQLPSSKQLTTSKRNVIV